MAYDPNDPEDKKIVQGLIDAALNEQKELHEADIEGLKNKNKDLTERLRKARTEGGSDNAGEVERLENELADSQSKLRKAESDLRTVNRNLESVTQERNTAVEQRDTVTRERDNEFTQNRLTAEFVGVKVGEHFLDDLVTSHAAKASIKEVNGERTVFLGDKPLGEFVKEWAESDKGKVYITAPGNTGGSAASTGNASGGAKKLYEMTEVERATAYKANPADFDARVAAGENIPPKT